jgi:pimeloyl-ACP methyl ester carboxylesterase
MLEGASHAEPALDGVILDSSFKSTKAMTACVLRPIPSAGHSWLLTLGLPMAEWHAGCPMMSVCPAQSIERLRSPVLFLHSEGDPLIPSEHSRCLFERAPGEKHLCVFELDGHCNGFFDARARYCDEVKKFSARTAPRGR